MYFAGWGAPNVRSERCFRSVAGKFSSVASGKLCSNDYFQAEASRGGERMAMVDSSVETALRMLLLNTLRFSVAKRRDL